MKDVTLFAFGDKASMDNCVLKTTWHTFKVVILVKFLTDDNRHRVVDMIMSICVRASAEIWLSLTPNLTPLQQRGEKIGPV